MRRALSLAVLLALLASAAYAQTTFATITGTVLDPSGLAVPGARVEAVQASVERVVAARERAEAGTVADA